ncbi:hypothetical protein D9756_010849 [Leucocoprinus leucothites]|uniref:Uncharacterized protein n=1 Tax=Leucocoprinus leucothites TaxID=201217 RepID=A0A8H5CQL2_9AGAR|nr:hypothetical protein D9756_010849 [Leucoagaricus leucothites]
MATAVPQFDIQGSDFTYVAGHQVNYNYGPGRGKHSKVHAPNNIPTDDRMSEGNIGSSPPRPQSGPQQSPAGTNTGDLHNTPPAGHGHRNGPLQNQVTSLTDTHISLPPLSPNPVPLVDPWVTVHASSSYSSRTQPSNRPGPLSEVPPGKFSVVSHQAPVQTPSPIQSYSEHPSPSQYTFVAKGDTPNGSPEVFSSPQNSEHLDINGAHDPWTGDARSHSYHQEYSHNVPEVPPRQYTQWQDSNHHSDSASPAFYLVQGHSIPDSRHDQLRRHSHSVLWGQPFSPEQDHTRNHHSFGLEPIPWAMEAPAAFQDNTPPTPTGGSPPYTAYPSEHDLFR